MIQIERVPQILTQGCFSRQDICNERHQQSEHKSEDDSPRPQLIIRVVKGEPEDGEAPSRVQHTGRDQPTDQTWYGEERALNCDQSNERYLLEA